jgi:hypothetical protein
MPLDLANTTCAADKSVWGFFPPPEMTAGFPGAATSTVDGLDADSFPPLGTTAGFARETTGAVAKSSSSPSRRTVVPEAAVEFASAGFVLFSWAEEGLGLTASAIRPESCGEWEIEEFVPAGASRSAQRVALREKDALEDGGGGKIGWTAAGPASRSRACIASSADPAAARRSTSALAAAVGRIVAAFC